MTSLGGNASTCGASTGDLRGYRKHGDGEMCRLLLVVVPREAMISNNASVENGSRCVASVSVSEKVLFWQI